MRSRIFFDKNKNLLLITNLKVGFTALNNQRPVELQLVPNSETDARDFIKTESIERVAFVHRNPAERWMSYYYHWFVNYPVVGNPPNLNQQFNLLFDVCDNDFYMEFCSLRAEDRRTEETMRRLCTYFPMYYQKDAHTRCQLQIVKRLGLSLESITDSIRLDDLSEFMFKNYNIEFSKKLKSGRPTSVPSFVLDMCKTLYAVDYQELGYCF
ncbi:hypothetical protein [Ruegeria sp. HKCCD7255]|uniref:hypothetical protein n=1 Tax=Ruegeria sp. HKCCD7255 TaxID=2683004 RepID=UPI001488DB51|nr:hypothetical protein [Ruegeria sp. HKCCD7255]